MIYLLIVSLIWAFSFGLIKSYLTGLDPNFVAWARMTLALPLFLPLLRWKGLSLLIVGRLILIGAVQYGLMYCSYLFSFQYLEAYQIALFTIFTPIYVTIINDLYKKRFQVYFLGAALLAVFGAALIRYQGIELSGVITGFLLMQFSNACFAFGQIEYRQVRLRMTHLKDHEVFAFLYLGAVVVTTIMTTLTGGWYHLDQLNTTEISSLLYLGFLPSGIGFFLWNKGATLSNAGTLAVFNNLKIPLAVFCAILFFGESTDIPRLILGGGIMIFALVLAERKSGRIVKKSKSQKVKREER